jgi:hypothetical protein
MRRNPKHDRGGLARPCKPPKSELRNYFEVDVDPEHRRSINSWNPTFGGNRRMPWNTCF